MMNKSWRVLGASSVRKFKVLRSTYVTAHGPMTRHASDSEAQRVRGAGRSTTSMQYIMLVQHHEHHEHQQPTQSRYQ
jgi:hypothetical protein